MKRLAIAVMLCLLPASLMAQEPVIYSKTLLKIVPKPGTVFKPAPAKVDFDAKDADKSKDAADKDKADKDDKPAEILPDLPRVTKEFTVDVRPLDFLRQKGFIAQQPFTDKGGMLIVIDPPQQVTLLAANLLAKVDVLFVRKDGLITKIAPDLALNSLIEPIDSEQPVHAYLFLKAGTAKSSDVRPGDHIENPLFQSHPVVLEESTAPSPPPPK